MAQGVRRQQRRQLAATQRPARGEEQPCDQRLQALHGIEQAHAVGRQHRQRQARRFVKRQGRGKRTQHRQAPPRPRLQPRCSGRARLLRAGLAHGSHHVHVLPGARGDLAHHSQVACGVPRLRVQPLHHGGVVLTRCAAEQAALHRATLGVDLRKVVGVELLGFEMDAAAPSQQACGQPLAGGAAGLEGAAAEHGLSGQPALHHGRALVQQLGRWDQAVVGVVPTDIEPGAICGARECGVGCGKAQRDLVHDSLQDSPGTVPG